MTARPTSQHLPAALREQITTAFLRYGQQALARLWRCSDSEVSRRLAGERNIPLGDYAAALHAAGIRLVTGNQIVIDREEYDALIALGARYFAARREGTADTNREPSP